MNLNQLKSKFEHHTLNSSRKNNFDRRISNFNTEELSNTYAYL